MRYIVSYDVSSDYNKYRTRIAQILIDYGLERIQYSVFIGNLTKTVAREIISKINGVIKEECPIDIRFFRYCASCVEDSFIITKDIKMPGFVLTKMEDALNVHVSYLTGKKFGIDIDQNGWLEVYPREPAECKEKKGKKKETQKKNRKDTNTDIITNENTNKRTNKSTNKKTNKSTNKSTNKKTNKSTNKKTNKSTIEEPQNNDIIDINSGDINLENVNPNDINRNIANSDEINNSNENSEDWAKIEKETSGYLNGLSQEELNDFLGLSNLEDLQEFTEYVMSDKADENLSESDPNLLAAKNLSKIEKNINLNRRSERKNEPNDKQSDYKDSENELNNEEDDPIYTMSKRVMFF